MATAPQTLPLFYQSLEPLSSIAHADWRWRPQTKAPFLVGQHAVPVTTDEFALVQRMMPIVFSIGDDPVPLALMGLNEGANVFTDPDGGVNEAFLYVPAYVRRYPFALGKLAPDSADLSLCLDPSFAAFEKGGDEGVALFENGEPSAFTREMLQFCEQFEAAGQRTRRFMAELAELDLLVDGETTIQPGDATAPSIFRGFRMVDETRLQKLSGEQFAKMAQSGMLPLIYAHLFSLSLMRDVFARQARREPVAA